VVAMGIEGMTIKGTSKNAWHVVVVTSKFESSAMRFSENPMKGDRWLDLPEKTPRQDSALLQWREVLLVILFLGLIVIVGASLRRFFALFG
jgi:hypothetical protein